MWPRRTLDGLQERVPLASYSVIITQATTLHRLVAHRAQFEPKNDKKVACVILSLYGMLQKGPKAAVLAVVVLLWRNETAQILCYLEGLDSILRPCLVGALFDHYEAFSRPVLFQIVF